MRRGGHAGRRAPANAANVLIIMTDDVGYGASTTFGGTVLTPTFYRVARMGARYTHFHTVALCWPTRAALLTGRDPHDVSMGNVTNYPTDYDGYTSYNPRSAGTLAETLRESGPTTPRCFGKGYITPEDEMSAAGPFDRGLTGLGFEYFFGLLSADTSAFHPSLVENTRMLAPPENDSRYHFERDLADHAIQWLRDQHAAAPDMPFFLYCAPGAAHTPHYAPPDWLERFRGAFDGGWGAMREAAFARQTAMGLIPPGTQLTARPASLPAWSSLSRAQQLGAARLFEAYAASHVYTDDRIGRLLDELQRSRQLDNTLIFYIQGDNGGSGEGKLGGPALYDHFPAAVGWAGEHAVPVLQAGGLAL